MVVTSTLAMLLSLAAPELSSVPMTWLAPAACPDAASVEARLADALADAPADTRKDITAHATVTTTDAGGFALDLRLTGDGMDATRALASTDCRELADATVLIVALAADPTVLDRGAIPLTPPPL
ncbi:MAG: hypothetical protein JKY37_09120, partial [Nannocystaceae bacterium]|nr:hypothetical protein [Nannocystaceae bacterium]